MSSPTQNSVWIDVFGGVLFSAVLLGGAGYLLYQKSEDARRLENGYTIAPGGDRVAPPRLGPAVPLHEQWWSADDQDAGARSTILQ